ncbi:MAG TPA: hypothetical protein VKT29_02520 [Terriglobales bacterium]|nr:hypothetical protein [Terriglobales bacterium]
MKRIPAILLVLWMLATAASAQLPSGNVFFGYSYLHAGVAAPPIPPDQSGIVASGSTGLNGWNASLEGKFLPLIGVVADFSGNYGSSSGNAICGFIATPCLAVPVNVQTNVYHFLVGPQISFSVGKVRPFAHALLGGAHLNETVKALPFSATDTAFSYALGGGIDYRVLGPLRWRVQGDFLRDRFFSGTQNNFRFSTGPVLHF